MAAAAGVSLLGRRDDVPELLRASDLCVVTALPDGEGMPGVLLEAALSGLPCVTTRIPGAASAVIDGVTGFIVECDDESGLIDRLRLLATDTPRREQMSAAAREHSLRHFSIEHSLDRWREVLGGILANEKSKQAQDG
jgi:glycosyltransferase involved in cell wall biosynthesis